MRKMNKIKEIVSTREREEKWERETDGKWEKRDR